MATRITDSLGRVRFYWMVRATERMGYHAVSCLDDAIEATRGFLLPFDRGVWLRLAVVVFFLSGGNGLGSVPSASTSVPAGDPTRAPTTDLSPPGLLDELLPLLVGIAVVFAVLGLAFTLVGAVMEFVLVEALRRESVAVRAFFRRHFRKGLSLLAFQAVLGLVVLATLGVLGYLVVAAFSGGAVVIALAVLAFALVAVTVGLLAALANLFTVDFAVPTMIHEDRGLVAAWKRLWPVLRANPGQTAVYALVRLGIVIAVGIAGGTVTSIVGAVVAVPFAVVAALALFVIGFSLSPGAIVVFGVLGVAYVLALLAAAAVVYVPLKTFVRYYELLVLGDLAPDLDLIPERREEVRASPPE